MTVIAVPEAPPNRTAEVALSITCPPWCTVDPALHAADLFDTGGECFHYSPEFAVADPGRGPHQGSLEDGDPAPDAVVSFQATSSPQGRESCSPGFKVHAPEDMSIEQVEALAAELLQAVALYRSWTGSHA